MKFELVPVRNQKFEIGRTINPFNCDCKDCTYMNCPKHNYAVKMRRRIPTFNEFWEYWKDRIIELNSMTRMKFNFKNQFTLYLDSDLISEMMDCISFPKGIYWNNPYDHRIDLVKFNRKGNEVVAGTIYIDKGNIFDYDLSSNQEKLANKISEFLNKIKDKIFEYYENEFADDLIGWVDPYGRHYICNTCEHTKLALMLGETESRLENYGWIKIALNDVDLGWFGTRQPTSEQRNFLSLHGYDVDYWSVY